jgi:hypothetical protein
MHRQMYSYQTSNLLLGRATLHSQRPKRVYLRMVELNEKSPRALERRSSLRGHSKIKSEIVSAYVIATPAPSPVALRHASTCYLHARFQARGFLLMFKASLRSTRQKSRPKWYLVCQLAKWPVGSLTCEKLGFSASGSLIKARG